MRTDTVMHVGTQANFELVSHPAGHNLVQGQSLVSHQILAGKSECNLHNNVIFLSFVQHFKLFLYHQSKSLCRVVRYVCTAVRSYVWQHFS